MFEKSKVKGYNRLSRSKSGFKVIRVKEFFRKKDENNTKRNLAIGSAVVLGAGGVVLLLRKNVNPKALLKKASDKYPKGAKVIVKDVVEDIRPSVNNTPTPKTSVSPKSNFPQVEDPGTLPISSKYAGRSAKLLVKKSVNQNRIRAKDAVTNDPWNTPVKSSLEKKSSELLIKKEGVKLLSPAKFKPETIPEVRDDAITNKTNSSISTVVQPNSKIVPLLTGKKIPASRGNLYGFDNRTARRVSKKAASDAARIDSMEKTYDSISPDNLAMKASIKIDHYLKRPRKTSNLGAPLKSTSLEKIIDTSSTKNLDIKARPKAEEKIIKQAQKKVEDRLSRAEKYKIQKEARLAKKKLDNSAPSKSRRSLLGVDRIKSTLAEREKLAEMTTNALAEKKSPMGIVLKEINDIAKDPEAERLGIQVRQEEWDKALATITTRRGAIRATSKGIVKGTESLLYARIVKPKIIKTLMDEVKSGNLSSTNPKGYAERLKRIHDNFDELMVKEGTNYRELSRRELGRRVGKVMEPEIKDATVKAKNFATNSKNLADTFYSNSQMNAALDSAGIKNETARFVTRMLMKLGGLG